MNGLILFVKKKNVYQDFNFYFSWEKCLSLRNQTTQIKGKALRLQTRPKNGTKQNEKQDPVQEYITTATKVEEHTKEYPTPDGYSHYQFVDLFFFFFFEKSQFVDPENDKSNHF